MTNHVSYILITFYKQTFSTTDIPICSVRTKNDDTVQCNRYLQVGEEISAVEGDSNALQVSSTGYLKACNRVTSKSLFRSLGKKAGFDKLLTKTTKFYIHLFS